MAIQALRGFRDFYPQDQAKINYLRTKIAAICDLFGYEEFEGPALESFDLYAAKSSDEIVNEQAFVFEDRGGEKITLRPELTPTLARMIAEKQNQLAFPIRWWSFGRFWRYERPQKGRGREFYQWNLDLLGDESLNAEVEILELVINFLTEMGLTSSDVKIDINDRGFMNEKLKGYSEVNKNKIYKLIDKIDKYKEEEYIELIKSSGFDSTTYELIQSISRQELENYPRMQSLLSKMRDKGFGNWLNPNPSIVRGLDYYTGMVFEVSDRQKQYRAMLGGGRYSNLIAAMGGQSIDGIGFGMGDMVILNFLDEKGLLPEYKPSADVCIIALGNAESYATEIASNLREKGVKTVFYGLTEAPGKGLKFANQKQIPFTIVLGDNEATEQTITLKNMRSGEQQTLSLDQVTEQILKNLS